MIYLAYHVMTGTPLDTPKVDVVGGFGDAMILAWFVIKFGVIA